MHASAGWYGDHTADATSDGVTVRKGLDLDTLALPALKFEIRSERDDPVGVRVVDQLPATIDPERVGVHADFAAGQWTAFEDGRVTFTTRIDPERPVVTLYGIWMDDPSRVHELLGQPDVKVATNPDAQSLEPVGEEVPLPTVDDSLRSVGPDALVDLRSDVEEALTAVRADPGESDAETPMAMPAPTESGDGDGDAGGAEPAGTMGDHAWTYPVERMGTGRISTPTHADLEDLVEDDAGEDHVYLRAALSETHHGGGGALLLQELANAFEVVARRVTGDDERSTVDAVVHTPLGTDAVLAALSDRDQVTDALVSPLVGDREDATGIDATPEEETAAADREGTEEVSLEPDSEDVEVVLNADGERFSELKSEFDHETDTAVLEDELAELELPGVDVSEEPSIDELVDGDGDGDDEGDDEASFVPASVDSGPDDSAFEFDEGDDDELDLDFSNDDAENPSGLNFAADEAADDDAGTAGADAQASGEQASASENSSSDDATFEFESDDAFVDAADATPDIELDTDDGDADGDAADAFDAPEEDALTASQEDVHAAPEEDAPDEEPSTAERDETAPVAENDAGTVEVPATELAALRTEIRELRDRVATLESDLAAVRADAARPADDDESAPVDDDRRSRRATDGGESEGPESQSERPSPAGRNGDDTTVRNEVDAHERSVTDGDVSVDSTDADPFESLDPVERADDVE